MADVRVAATLASLPRAVRLVAFDFDLCVLRVHSFGLRLEAADVAARDLGRDFVDLAFFVDLVRALVAAGVGVAVASFGRYEVIRAFLDRAFPAASPFTRDTISTPTTVGGMDGFSVVGGKNVQLAALAARFKVAPREILFFDDDPKNITLGLEGGFLCCVHCPSGFDKDAWQRGLRVALHVGSNKVGVCCDCWTG